MVSREIRSEREERIDSLIQRLHIDDVKPKTVRHHLGLLAKLYKRMMADDWDYDTFPLFKNIANVEAAVENDTKWKSVNTKKAVYTALAFLLRYLGDDYASTQEYYSQKASGIERKRQGEKKNNLSPENYLEDAMTWLELTALADKARASDATAELVYRLYTAIPPRRSMDFARMKIVQQRRGRNFIDSLPTNANYVVVSAAGIPTKLIFKIYKGKSLRTRGVQVFPIPTLLIRSFQRYIREFEKKPGDFLFTDAKHVSEKDDADFGKLVQRVFLQLRGKTGKGITHKLGINHLRHSYASYHIPRIDCELDGEAIAEQMATSLPTLRREYLFRELRCF